MAVREIEKAFLEIWEKARKAGNVGVVTETVPLGERPDDKTFTGKPIKWKRLVDEDFGDWVTWIGVVEGKSNH